MEKQNKQKNDNRHESGKNVLNKNIQNFAKEMSLEKSSPALKINKSKKETDPVVQVKKELLDRDQRESVDPNDHEVKLFAINNQFENIFNQIVALEKEVILGETEESLHQFRVNVRKLRTLFCLAQKAVEDENSVQELKNIDLELKWLNKILGEKRDIDVQISLSKELRDNIISESDSGVSVDQLSNELLEYKKIAQNTIIESFKSDKYAKMKQSWLDAINKLNLHDSSIDLMTPAFKTVRQCFKQMSRKTVGKRHGLKRMSVKKLHKFRKKAKTTRYILEFLSDAEPQFDQEKAQAKLTKAMKKIQNNLGKVLDHQVQVSFLKNKVQETMSHEDETSLQEQSSLFEWHQRCVKNKKKLLKSFPKKLPKLTDAKKLKKWERLVID